MKKCLPRDPCKPLFIELGILQLPCLFIYESVIFVKNDLLNGGNIFSCNIDIIITTHAVEITCIKCQYQQLSTRNQHTIHVRYFTTHCQMT